MLLQFMRKELLRSLVVCAVTCVFPISTWAAERSLPRGEDNPLVLEEIYSSPRGEMQILKNSEGGTTAFLRDNKGNLLGLNEVRGSRLCDEWLIHRKESLPKGCSFIFLDETAGKYMRVDSDELEEANLFDAVRGMMRGKHVSL